MASSASGKVPSIRKDKLNTKSCTLSMTVSRDSLSPAIAFSMKASSSLLVLFFMAFTSYILLDNLGMAV